MLWSKTSPKEPAGRYEFSPASTLSLSLSFAFAWFACDPALSLSLPPWLFALFWVSYGVVSA